MATRSSPITVGRDEELARIDEARAGAAIGRPVVVLVRGEAGIGKSRLVRDVIARAREAGSPILHGASLDLDGDGLPYLPFVEALRTFSRETPPARLRELLGPARDDLAALLPELAELDGPDGSAGPARRAGDRGARTTADASGRAAKDATSPDGPAGPAAVAAPAGSSVDRARLFERLLGFLGRLGADAPVVAVLEDIQWIDPATHDLVTFLVRNVTTEHVLALLTCRSDDLAPGHPVLAWMAELGRAPTSIRIDLDRLSHAEIGHQLEAIAGGPVAPGVVRSIWERSQGQPLFAEELLATELEGSGTAVPPSLLDSLLARVAALDADALGVVAALAIAGRPVDERLLGPAVGRTGLEVGRSLREATARGVLVAREDGRHAFRHELLREVVERDLSAGERRSLHEALAVQLEARPDLAEDGPAAATSELARHWAGADRPLEAHRAALAAAASAQAVHAFGDAHRQFERAIRLEPRLPAPELPPARDRIETRRQAAVAGYLAGDRDRAVELIRDALATSETVGDPALTGLLHSQLGFLTWAGGDGEGALAEHQLAVELVPATPPSRDRASVIGRLAGALMGLGRWSESRAICQEAIETAVEAGAFIEESQARSVLGSDLCALGEIEAGLEQLRESHRLAMPGPSELSVVTGHNLGLNLLLADQFEEALAVASDARARARDAGLERRYGMELAALVGDIQLRLGRWHDAALATAEGLSLGQADAGTPYLAVVRSLVLARQGWTVEAERRLAAIDEARVDPDLAIYRAIVATEVALLAGRPVDALEHATDGLVRFVDAEDGLWGPPLVALGLRAAAERAEALRAGRDSAGLGALLEASATLRNRAAALVDRAATASGRAWLATAGAEEARLDGIVDAEPWAHAFAAWDAVSDPGQAAYARYRFAETELRRAGVRAAVASELETAWSTALAIGAVQLQADIQVLARRARLALPAESDVRRAADGAAVEPVDGQGGTAVGPGRPSAGGRRPAPVHGLSDREIEVLRLVAAGRSNGEIGDELFITRKTAGVHVTHILDKLGVSNRVEAAMAAARLGLIEADPEAQPGSRSG